MGLNRSCHSDGLQPIPVLHLEVTHMVDPTRKVSIGRDCFD